MPRRSPLKALLAFVFVLSACSGGAEETVATTASTTTTIPPSTTGATTTIPPSTTEVPPTTAVALPTSPTNGMPVEDEASISRRVVAVKIDNHAKARPQSAIEQADAIYELLVEAGLTRFIALFHQTDSTYVGPMRSGRPTDVTLVKPLGATFFISGMQPWVRSIMNREDVLVLEDIRPASFRIEERTMPHNLYANTVLVREFADERAYADDPPSDFFVWGQLDAERAEEARTITFDWSTHNQVIWRWDGQRYNRWIGTSPHWWLGADGTTQSIVKADSLVVLFGRQYTAHPSGSGSSVPATETVGSGRALVFASGAVEEGTWSRESNEELFTLTDADGQTMTVPPGVLWISIFPNHREVTWS